MSFSPEFSPVFDSLTDRESELIARFCATEFKVAIQKDGELTAQSRAIIQEELGVELPDRARPGDRQVDISVCGNYGIIYARNKAIPTLVAQGAADIAVVGLDRLIEDGAEGLVDTVRSYMETRWPIVLATPVDSSVRNLADLRRIATQYPVIAGRFFDSVGLPDIDILTTVGGTEVYPYLKYGNQPIDGIIDMTVSGNSLRGHGLVRWSPAITEVYPVLIQKKETQRQIRRLYA